MSNIPNLVLNPKIVDKNGNISTDWLNYHRQLNTELQTNNSQEGIVIPEQETTNITTIASGSNSQTSRFIVDSTTGDLKFVRNGVIKTVTLT